MTLKLQRHNDSSLARGGVMGRMVDLVVATDSSAHRDLASALPRLGFRVRTCDFSEISGVLREAPPEALVTLGDLTHPIAHPASVHIHAGPCSVVGPDALLLAPAHPIQIASRVRALLRLKMIEFIARVRRQDAEAHGAPINSKPRAGQSSAILYVGAPDPAFMRLQHALKASQTDVIAAFSTFNAFDYLHERTFDAVVLNTDPDPELAHTVCSAMRRNTRLFHTPALLLTRSEVYASADEAFARGASDILPANASGDELKSRVIALTAERQRRRQAKALLEACRQPVLLDDASDLFSPDFGHAHLGSLIQAAADYQTPLCVIALAVNTPREAGPADGQAAHHALDQFASMLRHCVRAEDFAMRIDANRFLLALPSTSSEEARNVASRVSAIAECTAYEGVDPLSPFRLELTSCVDQWTAEESAERLYERALARVDARPVRLVAS